MRVMDAAIGAAWAMEEGALVTLLEIASRERQITPEALAAYKAQPLEGGERATFRDGVAIVTAEGPLFKHANMMTAYCGASSYDVLMRDFAAALDDGNVRAILVNVDSPGGEVSGCAEFAEAIFAARGRKPIVAYAGDQACSAAYWIASACDSIVVGTSGGVGSIGVRCTVPDTSARDARSGVTRYEFVSSQSPYKASDPATEDGKARIQSRVDTLAQIFVETVARNRDVPVARVMDGFGRGDVKFGAAAVAAGMADVLGTFESTLSALITSTDPIAALGPSPAAFRISVKGEKTMPTMEELNAAVERARVEATAVANATHAAAKAKDAAASASAELIERERVSGIHAACFAGHEASRDEAIRSGASVAEFKAIIVEKEHAAAALIAAVGLSASLLPLPAAMPKRTSSFAADGEAAADMIFDAFRTFTSADGPSGPSHRASPADEAAAAALIEAVSFLKH